MKGDRERWGIYQWIAHWLQIGPDYPSFEMADENISYWRQHYPESEFQVFRVGTQPKLETMTKSKDTTKQGDKEPFKVTERYQIGLYNAGTKMSSGYDLGSQLSAVFYSTLEEAEEAATRRAKESLNKQAVYKLIEVLDPSVKVAVVKAE